MFYLITIIVLSLIAAMVLIINDELNEHKH